MNGHIRYRWVDISRFQQGYSIKKRLPIGDPIYSYAVYAEGNNPKDFVSTYMNILDEAIKL